MIILDLFLTVLKETLPHIVNTPSYAILIYRSRVGHQRLFCIFGPSRKHTWTPFQGI